MDNDKLSKFAEKSNHPRHRHAALIFKDGELVVSQNNTEEQHAEVRAIFTANILGIEDYTLISIAVDRYGKLKLAKPCEDCARYAKTNGVKNILYSTKKQTLERLI